MKVLIVESEPELGAMWKRHLDRQGTEARLESDQAGAVTALQSERYDVLVLDLILTEGSAFAIADFASYRYPDVKVIFVTNTSFFSDGSIFSLSPNACAFLQSDTRPEDLAAMVEYHGSAAH